MPDDVINSVQPVTVAAIALITATNAEIWTKIIAAAVPALVATAYTVWKWRKEAGK